MLALQGRLDEAADCYRRAIEIVRIRGCESTPRRCLIYQSAEEIRAKSRHWKPILHGSRKTSRSISTRIDSRQFSSVRINDAIGTPDRKLYCIFGSTTRTRAWVLPGNGSTALPAVNAGEKDDLPGGTEARQSLESSAFPGRARERGEAAVVPVGNAFPKKIRIGFLSKFLRDHTIGDLLKGLIRNLSRSEFEVTVFLVGDVLDETVSFLRDCADRFFNLPEDVVSARQIITSASLDVLFYPDVGMDPMISALAFARGTSAVHDLGHPVTTGIPTIDYFISSKLIEPAGFAAHYSNNSCARFCRHFYYRPQVTVASQEYRNGRLLSEITRREFRLPQDAHIYLSAKPVQVSPRLRRPL